MKMKQVFNKKTGAWVKYRVDKKGSKMIKMADKEFATIDKKTRKDLGITKKNFRKEFAEEMRYLRSKK